VQEPTHCKKRVATSWLGTGMSETFFYVVANPSWFLDLSLKARGVQEPIVNLSGFLDLSPEEG